jgi:hypothetical protein
VSAAWYDRLTPRRGGRGAQNRVPQVRLGLGVKKAGIEAKALQRDIGGRLIDKCHGRGGL